jgi:hypothetical protein
MVSHNVDKIYDANDDPVFLSSTADWAAVSAAFPNQQRISKVEATKPYHPTQHMFMIEHADTLLETSDDCDLWLLP